MADNYQGGDAILNYAPLRQDYYKNQATQAAIQQQGVKAREAAAKQAAELTAKINPAGLRNADIPEFTKLYEEFRKLGTQVSNASSIQERAEASANMQNKMTDLDLFINSSKNLAAGLKSKGELLTANPYRAQDTQFKRLQEFNNLPTSKIVNGGFNLDNEFKLGARPEVWQNQVKSVFDEVQQEARNAKPELVNLGVLRENGRTIKQFQYLSNVLPATAMSKLQQRYESNAEARDAANDEASKLGISVPQYLERIVQQNKDSLSWRTAPQSQDLTPRKVAGSGDDDSPATYGDPITKNFQGGDGTSRFRKVTSEQYLPYNGGTISLPQSKSFTNLTDGVQVPSNSIKNAEVTGRGYFPKAGGGVTKGFTVSAQDANDSDRTIELFIPDREVPYDFKNNKKTLAAEKALGGYRKASPAKTNKGVDVTAEDLIKKYSK